MAAKKFDAKAKAKRQKIIATPAFTTAQMSEVWPILMRVET